MTRVSLGQERYERIVGALKSWLAAAIQDEFIGLRHILFKIWKLNLEVLCMKLPVPDIGMDLHFKAGVAAGIF